MRSWMVLVGALGLSAACGGSTDANVGVVDAPDGGSRAEGGVSNGADAAADGGGTTLPPGATSDGGHPCSGCARDWNAYPAIAQLDGVSELWVMSDVHGDYQALTTLLAGAKLVTGAPASPSAATWHGGTSALVIVGDLIDKGPDAPDVVRFLAALAQSAALAGGHVIATMGNHEAEFLADPMNGKATASDGFDPELQSAGFTPADTAAGKNAVGAFVRSMPIAARVDDWFFVHAGKTDGKTVPQLSMDLQSGIDAMGFGAPVLSATDSLLEAKLTTGALWWDATKDAQTLLGQWTTALGVKHLVMGHQPIAFTFADGAKRAADQMIQKYGGLLFLVDTGASSGVDATGGALLHVTNVGTAAEAFEEVLPTGKTKAL